MTYHWRYRTLLSSGPAKVILSEVDLTKRQYKQGVFYHRTLTPVNQPVRKADGFPADPITTPIVSVYLIADLEA